MGTKLHKSQVAIRVNLMALIIVIHVYVMLRLLFWVCQTTGIELTIYKSNLTDIAMQNTTLNCHGGILSLRN